jgi:molecular chaperone DnaK
LSLPNEEQSPAARPPVIGLQIKLPCASRTELHSRHGAELAQGSLFVRTRAPKPVGTQVRFDIRLADGESVLRGVASVKDSTSVIENAERPGMLLHLRGLESASQDMLRELGISLRIPTLRPAPGRKAIPFAPKPPEPAPPPVTEKTAELPVSPSPQITTAEAVTGIEAKEEAKATEPPPAPLIAPPARRFPEIRTSPVIGIDLGTTNSAAAWMHGGKPMIIPSREGYNTVPSVFAVDDGGRLLVGHPAKGQLLKNPRNTVYGAKRLIGRAFHSELIPRLQERLPYTIVEGSKGEAAVSVGGRVFTLQEISSFILKEVRAVARDFLGQDVTRAVITVPAYYSDVQRQAVREAGALAGLIVEQIVSEPTSAAVAFGHGRSLQQRVLVYDLGGGTFDVSVLELHGNNIYEVVSTGGDTFLGGVDFDLRLLTLLIEKFEAQHGPNFNDDGAVVQRFLDAAERTKMALSEARSHKVLLPFVALGNDRFVEFDATVTRAEFEQVTADLVDRTMAVTAEVLASRQLRPTDINEVLLVGGQSRMPIIRERLRAYFGKEPNKAIHPDEAVALGAAVLANAVETEATNAAVLVDVLPMSIGVGLPGGRFKRVIERNTPLPHTRSHTISTTKDDQTSIDLLVFQGEHDRALENQYLGSIRVDELPKAPRGSAKVDITFRLSREAVLSISAREESSGREETLVLAARETADQLREKLSDETAPAARKPGVFGTLRRWFGR